VSAHVFVDETKQRGSLLAEYGRIAKTVHLLALVDPIDRTY
jgi:hypothetical protein